MNINIRTKTINETTYYAAKDIQTLFDLSDYILKRYTPSEDKTTAKLHTSSGLQPLTVINAHAVNILSQHSKFTQEELDPGNIKYRRNSSTNRPYSLRLPRIRTDPYSSYQ